MINQHDVNKKFMQAYSRTMAHWDGNVNHGVVSAWVKIPGHSEMIWGRAYRDQITDVWTHGERACIENALRVVYGNDIKGKLLPIGCEMIVTLEPCSKPMDKRRGCSCSELIRFHGIETVYCGIDDPKHVNANGTKPTHPFNMIMATDPRVVRRCKHLRSFIPGLDD